MIARLLQPTAAEHATDKDAASRLWALGESLVGGKFKFKFKFNHTLSIRSASVRIRAIVTILSSSKSP